LEDSAFRRKSVDASIVVAPEIDGKAYLELNIMDIRAFKKNLNNFQTAVASEK
jgi:hypothetical protein